MSSHHQAILQVPYHVAMTSRVELVRRGWWLLVANDGDIVERYFPAKLEQVSGVICKTDCPVRAHVKRTHLSQTGEIEGSTLSR